MIYSLDVSLGDAHEGEEPHPGLRQHLVLAVLRDGDR